MKRKLAALAAVCMLLVWGISGIKVNASEKESVQEKAETDIQGMLGEAAGELKEALSQIDSGTAVQMFDFVKEKIEDGSLKTEEGLADALSEGQEKFGVTIDEEDAKKVVETMEKLEDMGFSGEYVVEKAKGLYEEYGADFIDHADEVIAGAVQNAVTNAVTEFFRGLWEAIKNFFKNLFSWF